MIRIALTVAAAAIAAVSTGCVSDSLGRTVHTDATLDSDASLQNTERFVVEQFDGDGNLARRFNRSTGGNTDAMTAETTLEGLFSITGEGTVGGANIVIPSADPGIPPALLQIVGQNDLNATGVALSLPDGITLNFDTLDVLASTVREARASGLDRWVDIAASFSETQRDNARQAVEALKVSVPEFADLADSLLDALVPTP